MSWWNFFQFWRKSKKTGKTFNSHFEKQDHKYLGEIHKPMVEVEIKSWDGNPTWRKFRMLVDTGADCTILPKYVAILLEIDLKRDGQKVEARGLGGDHDLYLVEGVEFRVGDFRRKVTVGFMDDSHVPPLLGRHQMIESFEVSLQGREKVVWQELG